MTTFKSIRKPIAIGAAAGVVNGLFGAGGGLLLVPLFMQVCALSPKTALATSLAVTLPLSVVSLVVYAIRGSLDFAVACPYAVGGILGGLLGAAVMGRLDARWLRLMFAAFLLYGGLKGVMLW